MDARESPPESLVRTKYSYRAYIQDMPEDLSWEVPPSGIADSMGLAGLAGLRACMTHAGSFVSTSQDLQQIRKGWASGGRKGPRIRLGRRVSSVKLVASFDARMETGFGLARGPPKDNLAATPGGAPTLSLEVLFGVCPSSLCSRPAVNLTCRVIARHV